MIDRDCAAYLRMGMRLTFGYKAVSSSTKSLILPPACYFLPVSLGRCQSFRDANTGQRLSAVAEAPASPRSEKLTAAIRPHKMT